MQNFMALAVLSASLTGLAFPAYSDPETDQMKREVCQEQSKGDTAVYHRCMARLAPISEGELDWTAKCQSAVVQRLKKGTVSSEDFVAGMLTCDLSNPYKKAREGK